MVAARLLTVNGFEWNRWLACKKVARRKTVERSPDRFFHQEDSLSCNILTIPMQMNEDNRRDSEISRGVSTCEHGSRNHDRNCVTSDRGESYPTYDGISTATTFELTPAIVRRAVCSYPILRIYTRGREPEARSKETKRNREGESKRKRRGEEEV